MLDLFTAWEKLDKAYQKVNNKKKPKPPPEPKAPAGEGKAARATGGVGWGGAGFGAWTRVAQCSGPAHRNAATVEARVTDSWLLLGDWWGVCDRFAWGGKGRVIHRGGGVLCCCLQHEDTRANRGAC